MIIITDCLTERLDEGCIKVANQLTMRIKKKIPETTVVSFRDKTEKSDVHLKLNKLFLNWSLASLLYNKREPVLYIPFSSNTTASVLRICILSMYTRKRVNVLYTLQHPMNRIARYLLRKSGARIVTLSEMSRDYYQSNGNETLYIKTGVDTRKFVSVSEDKKQQLREKYHVPRDKTVVLHVGHLNSGRNVQKLPMLSDDYYVILVCSPRGIQDGQLRRQLESCENIRIVDTFVEAIEEMYQLSDVYLFPVIEAEHCIDVPLSVLEAASCNVPVVATRYGELASLKEESGFCFISDCERKMLNDAVSAMSTVRCCNNRAAVAEYDWDNAVGKLVQTINA